MRNEPDFKDFEEVWRRQPFAPLIEIVLAIGLWVKRVSTKRPWRRSGAKVDQPAR